MFWRKKDSVPAAAPLPIISSQPGPSPRPILKTATETSRGQSIRFAGNNATCSASTPLWNPHVSGTYTHHQSPSKPGVYPLKAPAPLHIHLSVTTPSSASSSPAAPAIPNPVVTRAVGPRKSSRPTSPSTSSFGAKIRVGNASGSASSSSSSIASSATTSSASSGGFADLSQERLHESLRGSGASPLTTPPMLASAHITTPPTAYVSALQSRQPPPPSPYRPTTVSDRRPIAPLDSLPIDLAPRPPRSSSLYETPSAPGRSLVSGLSANGKPGPIVPMVNIIPATPLEGGEEFNVLPVAGKWRKRRASQTSLEESAVIHKNKGGNEAEDIEYPALAGRLPNTDHQVTIPSSLLDDNDGYGGNGSAVPQIPKISSLPSIDVSLEFSPFAPLADLPEDSGSQRDIRSSSIGYDDVAYEDDRAAPTDPLPPSPPFHSYSSLPSLESHHSMPSSASEDTMHTSSSASSLMSFPDVEEALGSMLASLSDAGPMPSMESSDLQSTPKPQDITTFMESPVVNLNHGLGLGLELPSSGSITAPLSVSPKRRPPPLDLSGIKNVSQPTQQTAPPCINHRVAFYKTAKAHPNSPASGTFRSLQWNTPQSATFAADPDTYNHSYHGSISSISSSTSSASGAGNGGRRGRRERSDSRESVATIPEGSLPYDQSRDSLSLASEASDDDLYTASIISLTPVMGERGVMQIAAEEVLGEEVGLAL